MLPRNKLRDVSFCFLFLTCFLRGVILCHCILEDLGSSCGNNLPPANILTLLVACISDRDRKLRIFTGSEHPFGDRPLEPYSMPPRQVREMRPRARRALIRAQKKAEQSSSGTNITKKKKEDKVEAITA
ncbi:uncharacterized protein M6B38_252155 [Iris pallida]|uniref:Uncharacterized protein n=1 Tax=Iris pallida TaxID=29817 RepID=A0AAX6IIM3_IRIPA|nr:uncharacterized protein M6B38_252155 [Iris pallida]